MVNADIGFSLWLDFVERDFLRNDFPTLIAQGKINGATSNPSIFMQAMTSSSAYEAQRKSLQGKSAKEIYEAMAIEDIRLAAQALRPCYDEGNDGFISIEVDPFLAHDTEGTVAEAKRLFKAIGEPNVMIKVPATEAGYAAMTELMSDGISVNATLIFSPEQAKACLKAMKKGLDAFENSGGRRIESVISVFVSRFDRKLDERLAQEGLPTAKTGIYNAAKIYNIIENYRTPSVRTLFASTSVKGDHLPSDYYIRELYAPHSVNTAPLHTIEAFVAGEAPEAKLPIAQEQIDAYFASIEAAGIDMNAIYEALLSEGLHAFEEAFKSLLDSLA